MKSKNIPAFVNESASTHRPNNLLRPNAGEIFKKRFLTKTQKSIKEITSTLGIDEYEYSKFLNG